MLNIISSAFTISFAWMFFNRLNMNYTAQGNYFDEETAVVHHQQTIMVFGMLTFLSILKTALIAIYLKKEIDKTKSF